jgi:RNA polymerase sigma factor (sigma-70 family)
VNDQQLLAAYLQGDEHAVETLVSNYYRLVVATATRATSDSHLAQDIAQTVFLIFARKARQLASEVSLPGWFIRTTNFVSRDALKKGARRSHYERASTAESRDATENYETTGAALLLTEAILGLPRKEQVCVVARFYDERPTAEIARDHGISEDAVQKRIERGLEKMRSFFARRGFRIATGIVPGLFVAAFPRGAEAQAVQTVLGGLHAAKTGAASTATLLHAKQLAQAISRRELLSIGLKSGAALLVAAAGVGSYVAVHEPAVPSLPPFRPSSPQVDALGRAWAQVARQIAAIMSDPQARQRAATNPPANIVNETGRVSSELGSLLTASSDDRAAMAEFLTIELRETLRLSPRQQAYVFSLFHQKFAPGDSFMNTLKEAIATKDEIATKIRAHLSYLQQRRFDYTYGKNFDGFMSFASLFTDGELRL